LWLVAGCGFAATFISIALVFVPPPDTQNIFNYEANLAGQSILLFVIALIYYGAGRSRAGHTRA
jgi:hypothetical protein